MNIRTKIIGRTPDDNNLLDPQVVVSLKYLSKFWRFLHLYLFKCETELNFWWTKNCIISAVVAGNQNANPSFPDTAKTQTTGATFQVSNAKFYLPVVTISINNNIKFLENMK